MANDIDNTLNDENYPQAATQDNIEKMVSDLKDDERVVVSKETIKKAKAPYAFSTYGNGKKLSKNSDTSINIVSAMMDMTKAERIVFNSLNDCMLTNDHIGGKIRTTPKKAKVSESNWKKGISLLIQKDYIRRVTSRGSYIINPKLLVPIGDPTVDYSYTPDQKKEAHNNYISTILNSWKLAIKSKD